MGWRSLLAAILLTVLPWVGTATAAPKVPGMPSTDGVISILLHDKVVICSGVNIGKKDDWVYALTATHCWKGGFPSDAIRYAGDVTGQKWIGQLQRVASNEDVLVVRYQVERPEVHKFSDIKTATVSTRYPEPGEVIWAIGVAIWSDMSPQVLFTSPGVYVGTPLVTKAGTTHFAALPITPGMSGGPVYVDGKVFGLYSMGYKPGNEMGRKFNSPWTGIMLLPLTGTAVKP